MTEPNNLEGPTPRIHVLIANLPKAVADLVASLVQQQQDMVLLEQLQNKLEILVAAKDADVLILGAPEVHPAPSICSHLLSEYPDLRIVVVNPDGDQSMLYWRGLRQRRLDSRSPNAVVTNIRQSYQLNAAI